ncbi:glycosyltransferase family 4 protein [Paenibacillus cisolokensis]|uniref:glycosyltransferase family 4 protein n=1 Tax=Paenibacillus cisolokensis TaxID=1658519 RepID=UPI003D2D694F
MTFKPKLLIFSHVSNPASITGAEKLLLFFCQELLPYFHCVLVAPEEGRLTALARESGIEVKIYKLPLLHRMYSPYPGLTGEAVKMQSSPAFSQLVNWIAEEAPRLVIVNTCVHFMPAAAARRLDIPVIWQLTEAIEQNGSTSLATDLIHRYSSWMICISEAVAARFPPELRQSKMSILPPSWREQQEHHPDEWPALRHSFRSQLQIGSHAPLIGMITSFRMESKGVHHFIDMALSIKDEFPAAVFLVVGDALRPEYEKQCQKRIEAYGASDRFIFLEAQGDIGRVYCGLDIVVVPSLVPEGFGLTALEGLLYGKPVVAYDAGGLGEVLRAAGSGQFLVETGSAGMLADRVRTILNLPDQGKDLGAHNRNQVIAAYGPEGYRVRLNAIVARWLSEQPGWFHGPPVAAGTKVEARPSASSGRGGKRKKRKGNSVRRHDIRRERRRSRTRSARSQARARKRRHHPIRRRKA